MSFDKPHKLFKYCNLDGAELSIKNQTVKFSDPTTFNDPFDCDVDLVDFELTNDLDEYTIHEIDTIKRIYKDHPGFENLINREGFIAEMYKHAQIQKIKSARISCFSLIKDNILLWSYYADGHKGICLEFNSGITSRGFLNLTDDDITEGEVGYHPQQKVNYLTAERRFAVYKLFLCKSEKWAHEKEFRIITLDSKPEIQKFRPEFLTAIYFGLNFPESQMEDFMSLCFNNGFDHLEFYKARKENTSIIYQHLRK